MKSQGYVFINKHNKFLVYTTIAGHACSNHIRFFWSNDIKQASVFKKEKVNEMNLLYSSLNNHRLTTSNLSAVIGDIVSFHQVEVTTTTTLEIVNPEKAITEFKEGVL